MSATEIQEKSLLEIWAKTFPLLPKNRLNTALSLAGLVLALLPLICGRISDFVRTVLPTTELLANVYAGLLGFIIAGYAIFTTAGNPQFLLDIWQHKNKKTGLPLLKLHLLVFVRLFITVFVALLLMLALGVSLRLWFHVSPHLRPSDSIVIAGQVFVLGFIGWSISATSVQLKVLIFNLYHLTLTQVRYLEMEQRKKAKQEDAGCNSPE